MSNMGCNCPSEKSECFHKAYWAFFNGDTSMSFVRQAVETNIFMINNRTNCFDEIRFVLAFSVLMFHAPALSASQELQWLFRVFDADLAVKGFFAISGYLVTKSFYSSQSVLVYFEKRARRIYPAYAGVILFCLLVGLAVTGMDRMEFLQSPQTYKYLGANLLLANFLQPTLPGVFDGNAFHAMNGALWTIKIEVMLYFLVPFLVLGYRWLNPKVVLILSLLIGIAWYTFFQFQFDHALSPMLARQFPGQLPYFALGSFFAVAPLPTKWRNALMIAAFIYILSGFNHKQPWSEYTNMLAYPSLVIGLSQVRQLSMGIGRMGDMSYGIYLFHFPVIQLLTDLGVFGINPWLGLGLSILVTLVLAFASWHLLEKGFLKRSSHYRQAEAGKG